MLSFTIGKSSISVFIDGEFNSIDESHANYEPLLAELKKQPDDRDLDTIRDFISVKRMIEVMSVGRVVVLEDSILYDGNEINNYMTQRMVELLQQGFDIEPWARFMDNVFLNPAGYAQNELYEWMEKAHMPLTPDGCFLGFKKVRKDYKDCHTGMFDNSPGTILEMDRGSCDPQRSRHCSTGFHFCSAGYLGSFGGQRVVVVKINPKDVTSIPDDYNFTKGRCCRYEVVAELTRESGGYDRYWSKNGLVDLENPAELPEDLIKNIKLPDPATDSPVQAESDPAGDASDIMAAAEKVEQDTTDAGKAEADFPPHASPFPTPAQAKAVATHARAAGAFETKDGRHFSVKQITTALKGTSIRAAARSLGIQDSTLRGWKKGLGL